MACRIKKRMEWKNRFAQEWQARGNIGLFLTLTYDEEHLPANRSISTRELQLYFKRVRRWFDKHHIHEPFKYYACGEYGPKTGRPHYHAVITGLSKKWSELLYAKWAKCTRANFHCEAIRSDKAASYVAGYTAKKLGAHFAQQWCIDHPGLTPPFQLQSQGIGLTWLMFHEFEYAIETKHIRWCGKNLIPCRYYRKVLGLTADDYKNEIVSRETRIHEFVYECYPELGSPFDANGQPRRPNAYHQKLKIIRRQCNDRLTQQSLDWRKKL